MVKARINRKENNYKSDSKKVNKRKVKMQRNNVCKKEDAVGYCLAHNYYVNWNYIGNVKKGKCINCSRFIKINNKKGEKIN